MGIKTHVQDRILCKAAGLNWLPVREWASAQIWIEQHSYTERLQMAAHKNLETGDVRRDSESITTKVCSQIGCKWNAIFENHVVTSIDRTRFDFQFWRFFEQPAFVNYHLLCYWPTIHNLILNICSKFQVLSSHFFEFYELPDEYWTKLSSVNISTPIYVELECESIML